MTTTKNNEHKNIKVPNKREQNQTCLDSAEREGLRPKGNVPNLRFKEFEGEWEKCKASDLLDFYSTNSLSWDKLEYVLTKLLQKSEMRKEIVIELSYKGFSRASDYS